MHPLLIPSSHAELEIAAKELVFSNYYAGDQSKCYLQLLLGAGLGLTIFESLHGVTFEPAADGKPGRVVVEPFTLIERVVNRNHEYSVKIVLSTAELCELTFLQNGIKRGTIKLTPDDLHKKGIAMAANRLYEMAYAWGVREHFPHLFGHKFYLRAELPLSRQEHIDNIVQSSGQKVVTADQLAITRKPGGKGALAADSKKLLDWQTKAKTLSVENAAEWDDHVAELVGFGFLTKDQIDDQFSELLGLGITHGVEYNSDSERFYITQPQLAD